jgi:hypothetical protein
MASTATPGAETSAHGIGSNHAVTVAIQPETQSAIPGLSDDVVVAEVLGRIKDPTDLARLRAVSRAMRDAVAATGHPVTEMGGNHAVVHGYLSTLKHLHRQGRLMLEECLPYYAAWKGQFEVLKWLHANGCPWDVETCSKAAFEGRLEMIQWLRANGSPWDTMTCMHAAQAGHLEVLQWLHANWCPWDEETSLAAARRGHLELLKWAIAKGCPWHPRVRSHAEERGHLELVNWAIANGCP